VLDRDPMTASLGVMDSFDRRGERRRIAFENRSHHARATGLRT
jgi:hypothetical protein